MSNIYDIFKLSDGRLIPFTELENHPDFKVMFGEDSQNIFKASQALLEDLRRNRQNGLYEVEFLEKNRDYKFRVANYSSESTAVPVGIALVNLEKATPKTGIFAAFTF